MISRNNLSYELLRANRVKIGLFYAQTLCKHSVYGLKKMEVGDKQSTQMYNAYDVKPNAKESWYFCTDHEFVHLYFMIASHIRLAKEKA